MPSDALSGFRAAVGALFKPGESAVTLFGTRETDGDGEIIWLNDVQDPTKLPPYWTLSVPGWYDPEMGNIHVPNLGRDQGGGPRTHEQQVCLDGSTVTDREVYRHDSPFIVFEVDYLYFTKDQHPTQEMKQLQRNAMAYAFQAAGFPFAVLTDSGGKSIHATVRLEDDLAAIGAWRASPEFERLQDLALVVFGDYDQGVMKQSGRARLVRTPGATRDGGAPQTILATGRRVSIADLMKWFGEQLSPEAQQEVWGRQPIAAKTSTVRQRYLRLEKWRNDLLIPHTEGERGTHWFHVSKSLMVAGCIEPKLLLKPCAQAIYGQWQASWLWYVSAFTFHAFSKGWFFSQDPKDWGSTVERVRWDGESGRRSYVNDQLRFEGTTDPAKNALVDQMMASLSQSQSMQAASAALPLPPPVGPPMHVGGVTGATLTTGIPVAPPPKKKKGEYNFTEHLAKFAKEISSDHLIKCSTISGDTWFRFFPAAGIWKVVSPESILKIIQEKVFFVGAPQKMIKEFYTTVSLILTTDESWIEYPNAIAFQNGTLYIDVDGVEFKPTHDPADKLRSVVPCHYDPSAVSPRWEQFVQWALPDPSRASLLQEAFGYTLIPGQPFQSFFMLTGTGSNGKSVILAVLQALHKDSFEAVALANLGGRFSLGTLGRKRLAIDTEAENVTNAVQGEGNSATAILKSWTGGDPVKTERKAVQGWSETINAKYFMSCNKKPRFVDPTKGVWRRLKLLKFEASIEERQADVQLPMKLITQELPGIVNWAIQGLKRLYTQNGFTQSEVLRHDLTEYQIDSDSVALFLQDFMRPAVDASANAWFDIRPVHRAYRDRCQEAGNTPVSETEFRERLKMLGLTVDRPSEGEPVNGCPLGTERVSGSQHWSIKGWRCHHPSYTTQTMVGMYVNQPAGPQTPMRIA
jgi:P4 family phage/plasmid primase-like protien